ncbi:alpha/beta hydrolase [Wenzhouxiangella sp. XN79A]|uniref:alpha/beta hydrolase n=1 Tax=Wenzhouxiangella sp. XN79A TaxID=2724193 RepID=UPI00144A8795|nr:alpha/beta hydrolase [Wenzhouxiangella sp. XN79A]NKI35429.1 alpha/beta hydrolase [Wenzhouxiangella sp. XN79A]
MLDLAWAVIPARSNTVAPDPVMFLAGGPGQAARDIAPIMQGPFGDVNRSRDLIFLDQRGTGGSNALSCEFDEELMMTENNLDELERQLRDCLAGLDADVRHYTTRDGAADLEALREHIGAEQVNLVGGSYGTRMAQVYLREYPDRVRAMILDGVVPSRLRLGSEHAEKLDQALGNLFTACAESPDCGDRFPGLAERFEALKAQYAETPVEIQVTHPRTGVAEAIEFSDQVLAASLRFLAYSPEAQMMIPYLVHEAATTGSPERLAAQALIVGDQMGDMIAIGLNFAVGCSEDWPHWPPGIDSAGTLLGNSMQDLYARVCDWWPADPVDAGFFEAFSSEVPTLLLSGERDPVTPPEYGEEAVSQFDNGRHLVAEGRGHIVVTNGCISGIATQFINDASVDELDTECMDRIGPEPFFLDLLGPAP